MDRNLFFFFFLLYKTQELMEEIVYLTTYGMDRATKMSKAVYFSSRQQTA